MTDDIRLGTEGTGPRVVTSEVAYPQDVDASGNAVADVVRNIQAVVPADEGGEIWSDPNTLLARIADGIDLMNDRLELMLDALK